MLKRVAQYFFYIAVFLSAPHSVLAQDLANMGTVVAVIGQPTLHRNGQVQMIAKGDALREGDELHTAEQTSVYIRTFDKGFIAVRPDSVLLIEQYHAGSRGSQFKLQLKSGLMRSVTGQEVQKDKDKYRLNTPVAAIGLRGTDFVVFTDDHATQVAVQKGGVVIEPFSKACSIEMGGPCQGSNSRELFASTAHMLEVIRGQTVAVQKDSSPVLQKELLNELPKEASKEPQKGAPKAAALGVEQTQVNTADLSNARGVANSNSVIDGSLAKSASVKPAENTLLPIPVPMPPDVDIPPLVLIPPALTPVIPSIYWGRWQTLASLPATANFGDIYKDGQELVNAGVYYVMSRDRTDARYGPELGAVNFQMAKHDGIIVNTLNGAVSATMAKESSLQINFAAQTFNTHLLLAAPGRDISLNVKGAVESDGHFLNGAVSEAQLRGVVSGKDAGEAGYIYYLPTNNNEILSGGTYWLRKK
ncbi:FecR family protein [Iodobacter ciconiae]|uniref:FecR protein domain-containing protein n=1 Tax=Iodobacter ciconiae TaxID=2496266 RepID=A0A3S8ZWR3_9NEIS|nr:FecR family protein [Iodobacter ciconiae]AZN37875.1 hypothetical protein EJO50_16220 [Iodobacter ciconiae]